MGLLVNPHGKKVSANSYFGRARSRMLKLVDFAAFCTTRVEFKVNTFDSTVVVPFRKGTQVKASTKERDHFDTILTSQIALSNRNLFPPMWIFRKFQRF